MTLFPTLTFQGCVKDCPDCKRPGSGVSGHGLGREAPQVTDSMLYTIEGNRSPRVQGFSYVLSRMDQLLGFGHVP